MSRHKIYGSPRLYKIGFDPATGVLDVNSLQVGGAVGGAAGTTVTASAANLNKVGVVAPVLVTAAGGLTAAAHGNILTVINAAAGIAITLPAATGTGMVLRLLVGTSITSLATTITAAGSDKFYGVVLQSKAATAVANYNATGTSSVFTMDGSTKGGLIGDEILLVDIGAAKWALKASIQGTGVIASPLS